MRQTAIVGSQKRLTRCFGELEAASEQHKTNSQNRPALFSREGAQYRGYITDEKNYFHLMCSDFLADLLNWQAAAREKPGEKQISFL